MFCQRKQTQLDAGGKAAWVGYMFGCAGGTTIQLRQTVNKVVVIRLQTIVHGEVDDSQLFGHVVALQKLACIAMCGAEEEHINLVERQLVCKGQIRLAQEAFVHVGNAVARVATAVNKNDFGIGVVEQQANQLACCVTCTTYNSYFNHEGIVSL